MNIKKITALILAGVLLLGLCACGDSKENAKYRTIGKAVSSEELAAGFRFGDKISEYVNAAIRVLAAEGILAQLSIRWFNEDLTTMDGDAAALEAFDGEIPDRTLIVGIDAGSTPLSFRDDTGEYTGFEVELAKLVCAKLGWRLIFQPINSEDMQIELSSGNVDCVWGGMSFAGMAGKLSYTESYIKNEKVLITLRESEYKSLKKLQGMVLATTFDPVTQAALDRDDELRNTFESIKKLNGMKECFNALENGVCAAILIDSLALAYYSR